MAEAGGGQAEYRVVDDPAQRFAIEQTRMALEAGFLGRFFGLKTNAPTSIAGAILFLLIVPLILMLFVPSKISAVEYLKKVLPVITVTLGYLFGKST
ncbi:MAG: hypothetical protein ACRERE_34275 [Candidatus Entotheonellia bacterium]